MSAFDKILLSDGVTELANVKRVTFRETVNAGQDLAPGCVGSASIEVEVFGVQATAVQGGDTLYYYQVDENNTDTLIGEFTAAPVIKSKGLYKFTAYDNARKLDADFSAWLSANQASFPMSIFDIVDAACTVAGVTLGSASWPLSTETVEAFYANGLTCRDIISYAAELAGRYVKCDENGELIFSWYTSIPAVTVYPTSGTGGGIIRIAYKQDGLDYSNYTVTAVTHVAVHPSGVDDAAYVYPTVGAQTNVMHIRNNLLLTGADASLFNAAAQQIYTAMSSVGAYRTCTAQLFPKESPFRAGDKTQVTDIQGVSFNTPIMSYTTSATAATIESTGNEVREDNPNTEKAIAQLASDVVRINKLKVDWADINTAIVNYLTANNVTAQNLTIVDGNGIVLATYNDNGIRLGQSGDTYAMIDYRSLRLVDKDGNTYFLVSDLRDANGNYTATDTFVGDGFTTTFELSYIMVSGTLTVKINGTVTSAYTVDRLAFIEFSTAPANGATIEATYTTQDDNVKMFTFGRRGVGDYGGNSAVFGTSNVASNMDSFATGSQTTASGKYSHAEGDETVASGTNSHAEGRQTTAAERSAHAEGERTSVTALAGHAEGYETSVVGRAGHAGGEGTIADGACQTAIGKFNVSDITSAVIVGNGSGSNSRSNAMKLDWNGNGTLAGTLYVNGADEVAADKSADIDNANYWLTNRLPNGTFRARQFGRMVEVYGVWTESTAPATGVLANSVATDYRPPYNYAILPIFSRTSPYAQVGTLWLYANGSVAFYGADGGGYVHGVYML